MSKTTSKLRESESSEASDGGAPFSQSTSASGLPGGMRTLALIAVAPVVAAAAFSSVGSDLPELTATADRPALLFATYLYHHGDEPVPLQTTLESEFRFRNESDVPVEITSVERSCGCMSPSVLPRVVEPGGIGSIRVPIATVNQSPGPHEYTLNVHYNDGKERETTLLIKAVFPEKMVTVTPPALYLSQKSDRSFPLPMLEVRDFRDEPLTVLELSSTAGFIDVRLAKNTLSTVQQVSHESGQAATTILEGEVAGSIPPGRHHAMITASTDDEDFPTVCIPMIVRGPEYPVGQAPVVNPEQFRLHASLHPQAVRTKRIEIMVPKHWEISNAQTWPEVLSVRYQTGPEISADEKLIYVDVTLEDLPPASVKDGVIQLYANDDRNLITAKASFIWP
ncbi:MAG: DUF1573 domain-containing protein [Planctomycetaceae bacterium]|nr:DUF1573 domain-containing protein [Planctomycetaceae bacterium]